MFNISVSNLISFLSMYTSESKYDGAEYVAEILYRAYEISVGCIYTVNNKGGKILLVE